MTDRKLLQLAEDLASAQKELDLASERIRAIEDVEEKFLMHMQRDTLIQRLHDCQEAIAEHQRQQIRELEQQRENQFFIRPR